MDNKIFIIIFAMLLAIMLVIAVYAAVITASNNKDKLENISIEEFNDIILRSKTFQSSRVEEITDISELVDIDKEYINKIYGKKSILSTDASLYLLVEPKEEKFDEVYSKLEEFCNNYEKEWSNYLENEYDMVVDRKFGRLDNYIYLIICEDSYDIVKDMKL
jgi:hypothetical protein